MRSMDSRNDRLEAISFTTKPCTVARLSAMLCCRLINRAKLENCEAGDVANKPNQVALPQTHSSTDWQAYRKEDGMLRRKSPGMTTRSHHSFPKRSDTLLLDLQLSPKLHATLLPGAG